ncbi:hypothetical protein ACWDUH_02340 [Micromonospora wenchangensis]
MAALFRIRSATLKAADSDAAPTSREGSSKGWIPLLIVDEVGYIPFEAEAANLRCIDRIAADRCDARRDRHPPAA